MSGQTLARSVIAHEARALLARLETIEPFSMQVPMVAGAAPRAKTMRGIEGHLRRGRRDLRSRMEQFLGWLDGATGRDAPASDIQRRFVEVRLRFNAVLSELDVFADALGQRAEHRTGIWLAGLDRLAEDALALPEYYDPPPVICYLDRGLGAAIRRARTRLPTGSVSPVAVIQIPRERMVGAGIGSSIAHEVGHQALELLELVPSIISAMQAAPAAGRAARQAWTLWERWISEVMADVWGVARIGVGAVTGLVGVVSLPRVFVFRVAAHDPHPPPWMRVRIACAIGEALYPNPQWANLRSLWKALYPLEESPVVSSPLFAALDAAVPRVVETILEHRPARMNGRTVGEVLYRPNRRPERLLALFRAWREDPALARATPPSLVFAVVAQARAAGEITAREEAETLARLLTQWGVETAVSERFDGVALPGASPGRRRALFA